MTLPMPGPKNAAKAMASVHQAIKPATRVAGEHANQKAGQAAAAHNR